MTSDIDLFNSRYSTVNGINNNGDVVGQFTPANYAVWQGVGGNAFLYHNGAMYDLNTTAANASRSTIILAICPISRIRTRLDSRIRCWKYTTRMDRSRRTMTGVPIRKRKFALLASHPRTTVKPRLFFRFGRGAYTAIVSGKAGGTGNALVEVYALP